MSHYELSNPSLVSRCKPNVAGRRCDKCNVGHYGFPWCNACSCDRRGTENQVCDQYTSECLCKVCRCRLLFTFSLLWARCMRCRTCPIVMPLWLLNNYSCLVNAKNFFFVYKHLLFLLLLLLFIIIDVIVIITVVVVIVRAGWPNGLHACRLR